MLTVRDYVTLNCGNCYRSAAIAGEARFFSCVACGTASFECVRCADLGTERGLAPVWTCAACSLRGELGAGAS
jgi:ribosomal protein L37AE/L43A